MTLHQEIAQVLPDRPAIFIDEETLSKVTLGEANIVLKNFVGYEGKITDGKEFYFRVARIGTVLEPDSFETPKAELADIGTPDLPEIVLKTVGGLRVEVVLSLRSNSAVDEFCTIVMLASDIAFGISSGNSGISIRPQGAQFVPSISVLADEELDLIAGAHGVTTAEINRIIGMMAYSTIQVMLSKTLDTSSTVSFDALFPGVVLNGYIESRVLPSGPNTRALVVSGSDGIEVKPGTTCTCADSDGLGEQTDSQIGYDENAPDGSPAGSITVGGISPVDPNTIPDFHSTGQGIGWTGIYLPRATADTIVKGPYPGFKVTAGGGGFVNWEASGYVNFSSVKLTSFDAADLSIGLFLRFGVDARGVIRLDFGKLGNPKVGEFWADQVLGVYANTLELRFKPAISDGVVYIKPYIKSMNIGPFQVMVNFFKILGSPFGAKGAIIGFIFDVILSAIFSHNLPIRLRRELAKAFANSQWKLIDLSEVLRLRQINGSWKGGGPRVDVLNDSMLVSVVWG